MLGASDPLPSSPRRIVVAGVSGVGKSTLCSQLSDLFALPYTEIDGLFHGQGWVPRPEFDDDVRALAASDAWVTEWQYASARPVLLARADLLIWLDLPFSATLARVIRRTIRRSMTRELLWNGNREPGLLHAFFAREGIVRWAVSTRNKYRSSIPVLEASHPDLTLVRLRSPHEVARWLDRAWLSR